MISSLRDPFTLDRKPLELKFRRVTLVSRDWLAPNYVRIRVQGDDLRGFSSPGADDHMRLFFPAGEVSSVAELREYPSREYTPLAWGEDWLDIEFVVHGPHGIAGLWAANAPIGAPLGVGGPRGSQVISGAPDQWLLAGDETAIPAIKRFARLVPAGVPSRVLIEVPEDADQVEVDADVEWIHRGARRSGSALTAALDAIHEAAKIGTDPFVFIAAEQRLVSTGRALLGRWEISPDRAIVKGYWKRGEAEYHAPH